MPPRAHDGLLGVDRACVPQALGEIASLRLDLRDDSVGFLGGERRRDGEAFLDVFASRRELIGGAEGLRGGDPLAEARQRAPEAVVSLRPRLVQLDASGRVHQRAFVLAERELRGAAVAVQRGVARCARDGGGVQPHGVAHAPGFKRVVAALLRLVHRELDELWPGFEIVDLERALRLDLREHLGRDVVADLERFVAFGHGARVGCGACEWEGDGACGLWGFHRWGRDGNGRRREASGRL